MGAPASGLLPREAKLVEVYSSTFNKTEAMRQAGYSAPNTHIPQVFNRPRVQQAIAKIVDCLPENIAQKCATALEDGLELKTKKARLKAQYQAERRHTVRLISELKGELSNNNNGTPVIVLNVNDIDGDINVTADAKSS